MNPANWERVKAVFEQTRDLRPEEDRESFVRNLATDPEIANEVLRLVRAHDEVHPGFLEPCRTNSEWLLDKTAQLIAARLDAIAEPGTILSGRYEVVRELGSGGVGVVYLARDRVLYDRYVVVKFLLPLRGADERVARRFQEEIAALARIHHPGVVGALDAGFDTVGRAFLVMEYVEGSTLRTVLEQPMDPTRAAHLIAQIASALDAAHNAGVQHRDLKPENVMLQRSPYSSAETVKLIDFGIAKLDSRPAPGQSSTWMIIGTVDYMAPEQLMGHTSPATDIYSLGIITYELLTGIRPFHPLTPFALYELQKTQRFATPSELRPEIPQAVDRVVLQALAFDPDARPRSASEFSAGFSGALSPKKRRSSGVWAAVGLVAATLILTFTIGWIARVQSTPTALQGVQALPDSPAPVTEPALQVKLNTPIGLARDSAGNVYVSDYGNHVVRRVDPSGSVTTIAGTGVAGYSGNGGPARLASLHYPRALAIWKDRYLYVSEPLIFRVRRVDLQTGLITHVLGDGVARFSGDGKPGVSTSIAEVLGIAVDKEGNLLVADTGNQTLRKLSNLDGTVSTIAGTGAIGRAADWSSASDGHLNRPAAVAVAPNGDIYLSDLGNYIIQRISAGTIFTVVGSDWSSSLTGKPAAVQVRACTGLAVAEDGSGLYFSDEDSGTIRYLDFSTRDVSIIAGDGRNAYSTGDGDPRRAALGHPSHILLEPSSSLLVAEPLNNLVRRVGPGRSIAPFAGSVSKIRH